MFYIIIGHSMGSIIARLFVEKYPDIAQGLILTGTGMFPKWKGVPLTFSDEDSYIYFWETTSTQMGESIIE